MSQTKFEPKTGGGDAEKSPAKTKESDDVEPASPEIEFKPIVSLPLVEIKTLEEDEDVLFKMRAKLYRYDKSGEDAEWKERGIGEVKILQHHITGMVRLIMRREKTLKICANHSINPSMSLKPHVSNDKAMVWNAVDFADEEPTPETLCIRFGSGEKASEFKKAFENAKELSLKAISVNSDLVEEISKVTLSDNTDSDESEDDDEHDETNDTKEKPKTEVDPIVSDEPKSPSELTG